VNTNHSFKSPRWVGGLGHYAHAIVQGNPKVGATAYQDNEWIRVRGMLGQEDGHAFQWICATSQGTRDGTGDVGEDFNGCERRWVKNACFIVVPCSRESAKSWSESRSFQLTNEYVLARENMKEGIEVVWVCPLEPVEGNHRRSTRNAGENLKRRVARSICACLAAHNEDTAIGHDKGGRIPTSTLREDLTEHRRT
jgi:hypothetical protein